MKSLSIAVLADSVALPALGPAQAAAKGEAFLKKALGGDLAEVQMGKLAQEKGSSDAVRSFGQTLVTDHSKAQQQATETAQSLGVTAPSAPPKKAQDEKAKLSKLSGKAFDRAFIDHMVQDHKKDIAAYTREAKLKADGKVAELASESLPTLRKHLQLAQSMQKDMKAKK